MKKVTILVLLFLVFSALLVSCATSASKTQEQVINSNPQKPVDNPVPATPINVTTPPEQKPVTNQVVKISDILNNPKSFDNKTVAVEGKIVSECGSGCWFTLQDGAAVIYIDLAPSNLVIPQKKGAYAKVTAKVVNEGSDVYLIGKKVEF